MLLYFVLEDISSLSKFRKTEDKDRIVVNIKKILDNFVKNS